MDALVDLNRLHEMGFAGTAPRGLLYILRETIRLGTPAAVDLRGPRPFPQLLQRVIQDDPDPTRRGPSPWAWILLNRPLARRRQIIASRHGRRAWDFIFYL